MIAALRRVLRAPGVLAAVWLLHVAVAATIGLVVHAAIDEAIRPHEIADDGRRLFALLDVLQDHRGVVAAFSSATLAAAVGAALSWTLVSGLLLVRLSGERRLDVLVGRFVATLPAVIVQSLWHLVSRALLLFAVLTVAGSMPRMLSWPLLVLAWAVSIVALDLVRAEVVLGDARRYHPRTAAAALLSVVRTPRRLAGAVLLAIVQLVVLLAVPYAAVAMLGRPLVPAVTRGLALVAAFVGLWRLSAVVGAVTQRAAPQEPTDDPTEADHGRPRS